MNPRSLMISSVAAAAAALHAAPLHSQTAQPVAKAPVRPAYVTRFPLNQTERIPVGNFDNVAFTISLAAPSRSLAVERSNDKPELVASYDYADCSKGQERLLEAPVAKLKTGDAAWVDYVDIELVPNGPLATRSPGSVCFGSRGADGTWRWSLTRTPLTSADDGKRVHGRLWIKDGPIDAIKLVFDHAMPRQSIDRVTVVAQPFDKRER